MSKISPTGSRYVAAELHQFLDSDARLLHAVEVELLYVRAILGRGPRASIAATPNRARRIVRRARQLEGKLQHETAALVAALRENLEPRAAAMVHAGLTSSDILDTADALRYKRAIDGVVVPDALALAKILLRLVEEEADTLQVGRTHGQFAEPVTIGLFFAIYLERWISAIGRLRATGCNLPGKISGAVGAYLAPTLVTRNPQAIERRILSQLGLRVDLAATQRVSPEPLLECLQAVSNSWGILANLADDLRHLARSEIQEIGFKGTPGQVFSSSMPHKTNPLDVENVKASWKEFMPRILARHLDQVSEHQRDLTDSLGARYVPEMLYMFDVAVRRMTLALSRLRIDRRALERNLAGARDAVLSQARELANRGVARPLPANPDHAIRLYARPAVRKARSISRRARKRLTGLFESADRAPR